MARCGTAYGYQKGCHCDLCRAAVAAVQARHRERRKAGLVVRIPAGEARQHLRALKKMGFTWNAMDIAADTKTAQRVGTGVTKWITPRTADVLLGLTVSDLQKTSGILKLARPTHQQIKEMQAAGYSLNWIQRQVGHIPRQKRDLRPRVWQATQEKVQALHDELWKNNTHNFRASCKCMGVFDPEVLANRAAKRAERAAKATAA